MSKVSNVVATRSFERAVKKLRNDHNTRVLNELKQVVIQLVNGEITKQKSNHPLKNAKGHKDIHLGGGDYILLYRYDADEDTLYISLRLQDVVNHDQLANYNTAKYDAPVKEYDIDNITNSVQIQSSQSIISSESFNAWYDSLDEESQWMVDDIADSNNIPLYNEASDEELSWLKDAYEAECINCAEEIEKDENDLDETEQEFSSKGTAINGKQGKLPAIFKMITIPQGSLVLDFGGGDEAADAVAQAYLDQFDATELLYDKFNQTPEHNREVVKTCRSNGGADIAVCSNVLNVIKEPEVRLNVLENIKKLTKPGGDVYITVYEGSGKGEGAATQKNTSYQNNKKTEGYLEEVQQVFSDATRKGKLIKATNSESISSAVDITASEELDTCVEEIRQAARKFFQEPHIGFPENEIDDYLFIDTKENEYDPEYITIEVRAELSYDACVELADILDTIVTKYDPDAYFDMEAPGIMVCAIPKSTVNASIQASIYDPPGMYRGPEPDDVMYADPDVAEINVYIDGDVEVAEDGSWVWLDDDWARPYDNEDMWYSEDGTPLQDYNDVVENIDLLIMQYIPGIAGKYHIKGDATLVYDIDDIAIEPGDEFGDATYYYEEATADYNSRESSVENIEVEEIIKLV